MATIGLNPKSYSISPTGVQAAAEGANNLAATTSKLFTFSATVYRAVVQNDPDSGGKLYVRWNAAALTDVGATTWGEWDCVLSPGDLVVAPAGLAIGTVALVANVDMTAGTDFTVVGWE